MYFRLFSIWSTLPVPVLPNKTLLFRRLLSTTGLVREKPRSWQIGKLNHVALAVADLGESCQFYKSLGASLSNEQDLPEHGVKTVFVDLVKGSENSAATKLELLRPLGENSPISSFVTKNPKGGIHHLCFEVNNITEAIRDLNSKGIRTLSMTPSIGAHGKPVVFLHPKYCGGVLIELEEV